VDERWQAEKIISQIQMDVPTKAVVIGQDHTTANIERPRPLDTDSLEAECARLFNVSPKFVSDTAEKLYNLGFITYPRTESSYYLYSDLTPVAEKFLDHPIFGELAKQSIELGTVKTPSKGRFTKDHEPITPVKPSSEKEIAESIKGSDFENNLAWRIYEYITRRFFATIFSDGILAITTTAIDIAGEEFTHTAQRVAKLGFLEFYPYKKVTEQFAPAVAKGDTLTVTVRLKEEHTLPPELWTESQLIREMSRLNIGTDATRSQHIATIQNRGFVKVQKPRRTLLPTELGLAFYKIFIENAQELIIPQIRERVETWARQIYEGTMTSAEVDYAVIQLTGDNLKTLVEKKDKIFPTIIEGLEKSTKEGQSFGPCGNCGSELLLTYSVKNHRYLACSNEDCNQRYTLPKKGELFPLAEQCKVENCQLYPIQVGTGTKSWVFCPNCWIKRQDSQGLMFCSHCDYDNCLYSSINRTYSTKVERGKLGTCPICLVGEVALFFEEWKTVIECLSCKTVWPAPNIRAGSSIEINGPCKLCAISTLIIKRKNKSPYNMCPICSLLCFQCIHRCYG
jgi:hypothetical protein